MTYNPYGLPPFIADALPTLREVRNIRGRHKLNKIIKSSSVAWLISDREDIIIAAYNADAAELSIISSHIAHTGAEIIRTIWTLDRYHTDALAAAILSVSKPLRQALDTVQSERGITAAKLKISQEEIDRLRYETTQHGRPTKYTADDAKAIACLLADGLSIRQAAAKYRVSTYTIQKLKKQYPTIFACIDK